jgi:hypothetical protein
MFRRNALQHFFAVFAVFADEIWEEECHNIQDASMEDFVTRFINGLLVTYGRSIEVRQTSGLIGPKLSPFPTRITK